MIVLYAISVFWIVYGVLGVFGIKTIPQIPRRYKDTEYEKPYKKFQSAAYLLLGVPCFVILLLVENKIIALENLQVAFAVCIVPAVLYAVIGDMIFRKRLKK